MTLPRVAITIAFNAKHHLIKQERFCNSNFAKWIVVEGPSESVKCTSWCKTIPDDYIVNNHSADGTLEYLTTLTNIKDTNLCLVYRVDNSLWKGKVEMFNAALEHIDFPCYLWEIDSDEYWTTEQLEHAELLLENTGTSMAAFACNYYLTDQIIVRGTWGESIKDGYRRLWMYEPGQKFLCHEPPILSGHTRMLPPSLTPRFNHYSYYYSDDVKFKTAWYKDHENIYKQWTKICNGEIKLPCSITALFGKEVPSYWKDTIITYA